MHGQETLHLVQTESTCAWSMRYYQNSDVRIPPPLHLEIFLVEHYIHLLSLVYQQGDQLLSLLKVYIHPVSLFSIRQFTKTLICIPYE